MRPEQERVRQLLTEAVTLLCRNSLQYSQTVKVEGLIGITIDERDIFLVSLQEGISKANASRKRDHNESNPPLLSVDIPSKCLKKTQTNKKYKAAPPENNLITSNELEKILPTDVQIKCERASPVHRTESTGNDNFENEILKTAENDTIDGRNIHPAYDESDFKLNSELSSTLNDDISSNMHDSLTYNPVSNEKQSNIDYLPDVSHIKEETNDDDGPDECFVIDSEDESSRSHFLNNTLGEAQLINSQHWPDNMDASGNFGMPDSDLLSSSQLSNMMQYSPQPGSSNSFYTPDSKMGISPQAFSDGKFDVRKMQIYYPPPKRRRGNPNIRCQVCGDTFVRTRNLKRHMYRKHYKKQFHCFCGKEYGLLEDLNSHQKLTHHYEYVNGASETLKVQYKKYIEAMASENFNINDNSKAINWPDVMAPDKFNNLPPEKFNNPIDNTRLQWDKYYEWQESFATEKLDIINNAKIMQTYSDWHSVNNNKDTSLLPCTVNSDTDEYEPENNTQPNDKTDSNENISPDTDEIALNLKKLKESSHVYSLNSQDERLFGNIKIEDEAR